MVSSDEDVVLKYLMLISLDGTVGRFMGTERERMVSGSLDNLFRNRHDSPNLQTKRWKKDAVIQNLVRTPN